MKELWKQIEQTDSVADQSTRALKQYVDVLDAHIAGNGNQVVKSLNGPLIDRACEHAIHVGKTGALGLLSLSHGASSSAESAAPSA